ncbi:MAG: DUF4767 domain-containing protein [Lactobacillus sp.]|jgi:hypothetical protein|nr:DUF4767 domain-containing protein [Lactobacillus sp.]MCI2033485.1 DUF4767 domain-containing protein [Lactobacillus sp.]
MKIWQTATLLSLGLVLTGCGGQQAAKSSNTSSMSSVIKSSSAKTTGVKLAWDDTKAKKLAAFMQDFGTTMNQSYTQVGATTHAQWQGTDLATLSKGQKPINLAGTTTKVTWLPQTGQASKTQPNVVAVYVDNADKILYLFTLTADGQAKALVSQAAANADVLAVKETANTDLAGGFKAIAAGQDAANDTSSTATAASSSSSSSSQQASPKASASDVVFNSSYQHTWYTYDDASSEDEDSSVHQIQFTANSRAYDGTTSPVYPASKRTAADEAVLSGDTSQMDESKSNWGAAGELTDDGGRHWINVRGWYQGAGDGTYYRIVQRNLDGQMAPVLEVASGAEMWHDSNYFLTEAQAQKYKDITYDDEHAYDD